jgi:flagellar hook-basal body complex protein FliE
MDMKAVSAIQKYALQRPATEPAAQNPVPSIAESAKTVAMNFAETLAATEEVSKASMIGDADPHALVQALAQTELAVETAVTVRNKVVEAYQEILRMPV